MKMTISEAIQIVKDECYKQEPKNFAEERVNAALEHLIGAALALLIANGKDKRL